MQEFIDDDDGYLSWVDHNPGLLVLNTERSPRSSYLKLHRATCSTITNLPANGTRWTGDYIKVCGTRAELESWAQSKARGTPQPCPLCM